MTLPKSVADAENEVDDLFKAQPVEGKEKEQTQPKEEAPVDTKPATPDELTVLKNQVKLLEQRYKTADGIAKAAGRETKELRDLMAQIKEDAAKYKAELDVLKNIQRTPEEPKDEEPEHDDFYSADELKRIKKIVAKTTEEKVAALQAELAALKQQASDVGSRTENIENRVVSNTIATFNQRVLDKHPDTERLIKDESFIAWATQPIHPLSQQSRWTLLAEAQNMQDADAANAILDEYKKLIAKHSQPKQKADLSKQVMPSRTSAPQINLDGNKASITLKQIEDGYDQLRRIDKYSPRYAELEAKLMEAERELLKQAA